MNIKNRSVQMNNSKRCLFFIIGFWLFAVCFLRLADELLFYKSTARSVYILVYILNEIKVVSNKKGRIFIQRYLLKSSIRVTLNKRSGSEEYRNKSLTKNWMISTICTDSKFLVSHVSPDYLLIFVCLFCFVSTLVIEASWIARVWSKRELHCAISYKL